jgi:hypothetical protein
MTPIHNKTCKHPSMQNHHDQAGYEVRKWDMEKCFQKCYFSLQIFVAEFFNLNLLRNPLTK